MRGLGRKHLFHDFAIVAQRQVGAVRRRRGEQLATFAVRYQQHTLLAILLEETRSDAAKAFEVAVAQGVGERQNRESAGHSLNLGIEHETDTARGFEHALGRSLAVLLVIIENDDGRKNNQRQRGSRNQKSETNWQGEFQHAGPAKMIWRDSDKSLSA